MNRRRIALSITAAAGALASLPVLAATSLWWDTNYLFRFNVDVQTGANAPDKGYNGYTARVAAVSSVATRAVRVVSCWLVLGGSYSFQTAKEKLESSGVTSLTRVMKTLRSPPVSVVFTATAAMLATTVTTVANELFV